ncbi:MAG: alpha-amylase family glycosyl hydrolase, partial [Kiritimatiellia bacterium]|nr:alpha-amylase family glycosyl hydrolase [Kiritimatiellia bacterium]
RFWQEIRREFDREYPEAALIAEWGHPAEAIRAGFHVDFMIHFGLPGYPSLFFNERGTFTRKEPCYFDRRGQGCVREFIDSYVPQFQRVKKKGWISIPSANHDYQRPGGTRGPREMQVLFTFILTWPGVPMIYYGDEIGMRFLEGLPSKEGGYGRTGTRTPMQWDATRNAGFSAASAARLYLPIDPKKDRPTVAAQEGRAGSLLNTVRQLTALRQSESALQADGELTILYAKPKTYPFVYLRGSGRNRFLIAVHPAARPVQATFDLPKTRGAELVLGKGTTVTLEAGKCKLEMTGLAYAVFRLT